jgi:hypothetical protein
VAKASSTSNESRLDSVKAAFDAVKDSASGDPAYTAEGLLDAINAWDASQSTKFFTSDEGPLTLEDKVMLAAFLGNTGHESDSFKAVDEYGCPSSGDECYKGCPNPEKEPCTSSNSPDWGKYGRYYGRGAIQLSHDYNYNKFANAVKDDNIDTNPDVVAQCAQGSCYVWQSALWFWSLEASVYISKKPYSFAGTIKSINGYLECPGGSCTGSSCNTTGANDSRVADRIAKFHAAAKALGVSTDDVNKWETNDGSGANWKCPSGSAGSVGYCRAGSPANCGQKCSNESDCGNDKKTSSFCWAMTTPPTQQQCDNPPAPSQGYCMRGAKCGAHCATEGDCGFNTGDASCQALTSPPSCSFKLRGFLKSVQ